MATKKKAPATKKTAAKKPTASEKAPAADKAPVAGGNGGEPSAAQPQGQARFAPGGDLGPIASQAGLLHGQLVGAALFV